MSFGQPRVEAADPPFPRHLDLGREAGDLPERVDPGVGSAAAPDRAVLDAHLVDGLFEHPLHGPKPRLGLPAVEVRPVVPEADAHTVHEWRHLTHE